MTKRTKIIVAALVTAATVIASQFVEFDPAIVNAVVNALLGAS